MYMNEYVHVNVLCAYIFWEFADCIEQSIDPRTYYTPTMLTVLQYIMRGCVVYIPVCVVPYLDSPVSSTRSKHLLMKGVPLQSMYGHVVVLENKERCYM